LLHLTETPALIRDLQSRQKITEPLQCGQLFRTGV